MDVAVRNSAIDI